MDKEVMAMMNILKKYKIVDEIDVFKYELVKTTLERMFLKGRVDGMEELLEVQKSI